MNSQFVTPVCVGGNADFLGYSGLFNQGDVDIK